MPDISEDSFRKEVYFPTLIFCTDVAQPQALNESLLEHIYAEQESDSHGVEHSNFRTLGGWHSRSNLHRDKAYKQLTLHIRQAGRRIAKELAYNGEKPLRIGTMWSIINAPGAHNKAHIHPDSLWSGVYYVQVPEDSGDIEFYDPRTQHLMREISFATDRKRPSDCWTAVRYKPRPGQMLMFPSWLYHGVYPNLSQQEGRAGHRVIISFNMTQ